MRPSKIGGPVPLGLPLLLVAGLFAHSIALGQSLGGDAISREISIFNYGVPPPKIATEAISREVSLVNFNVHSFPINPEAISREVSVFNCNLSSVIANPEGISRELSVFNFSVPSLPINPEAISREISVFNFNLPSVSTTSEAISREVTIFNAGVVFVAINAEAISRELSVFNYGLPPVVFVIGSTNALRDESQQVPFALQTVLDLTNLNLTLQTDESHLRILGVTPGSPEVVSMVLGTANSNGLPIAFTLNPTTIPSANHVLAYLDFQGITNLDSAIVPLTVHDFAANRTTGQNAPGATTDGRVILIVNQAILFPTNGLPAGFTMYGLPGATYSIQATTNLAPSCWVEVQNLLESGPTLKVTGLSNRGPQQFYRASQVNP